MGGANAAARSTPIVDILAQERKYAPLGRGSGVAKQIGCRQGWEVRSAREEVGAVALV